MGTKGEKEEGMYAEQEGISARTCICSGLGLQWKQDKKGGRGGL